MSGPAKQGKGRPTKLTPELQQKVCDAIKGGNYRYVAAEWAGVGATTMRAWMAKGKTAKSGPFQAFRAAVLEAEKAAEITSVALIMKAAREDPKHAQWWLERKFPSRWGRKDRQEISGPKGRPVQVEQTAGPGFLMEIAPLLRAVREALDDDSDTAAAPPDPPPAPPPGPDGGGAAPG